RYFVEIILCNRSFSCFGNKYLQTVIVIENSDRQLLSNDVSYNSLISVRIPFSQKNKIFYRIYFFKTAVHSPNIRNLLFGIISQQNPFFQKPAVLLDSVNLLELLFFI